MFTTHSEYIIYFLTCKDTVTVSLFKINENLVFHDFISFCVINLLYYYILYSKYYLGFWLKEASYKEQPEIHFKHQFLVFFQGLSSDSYLAYSTYQNFNNLVNDKLRVPTTKVTQLSTSHYGF